MRYRVHGVWSHLSNRGQMAVDMDQVEMGDCCESHRLSGSPLLLLNNTPPREGVDGQNLAGLVAVPSTSST